MGLYRSISAISAAEGDVLVDWSAAAEAAVGVTEPGRLDIDDVTEAAYRAAIIEARDAVGRTVGTSVSLPGTIEVIDRHHWIDQASVSFERMLGQTIPDIEHAGLVRTINTSTAAFTLAVLGRRVIGQYDPALFGDDNEIALYVVHPNVATVAEELSVDETVFRRWVLHHEVTHAAEFDLAPWLRPYLEDRLGSVLSSLSRGDIDRENLADLSRTMTAVEGFAELVMDVSMDDDVTQLRDRLEARRAGLGPVQQVIDWLLGITSKRRQYRLGRSFFTDIEQAHGMGATLAVWEDPSNLPSDTELADPSAWVERVNP